MKIQYDVYVFLGISSVTNFFPLFIKNANFFFSEDLSLPLIKKAKNRGLQIILDMAQDTENRPPQNDGKFNVLQEGKEKSFNIFILFLKIF